MFGRKAEDPESDGSDVGAEADAALDHALRETSLEQQGETDFDDDPGDDLTENKVAEASVVDAADDAAQDSLDAGAAGATDDAEEYVLYSEVEPHLRELVALQKERGRLIDLLLYAADRVSSPAAAERVDDGLRQLGIESLRPDGEVFDPAHHEASASVDTDDAGRHGRVAETETPGYSDNGRLVRPPIVTVYRARGAR